MSLVETLSNRELLWNLTCASCGPGTAGPSSAGPGRCWIPWRRWSSSRSSSAWFSEPSRRSEIRAGCTATRCTCYVGLLPWSFFAFKHRHVDGISDFQRRSGQEGRFPHEVLVVSSTASAVVSLAIEMGLLSVVLLIAGNVVVPWLLPLTLLLLLLAVFSIGCRPDTGRAQRLLPGHRLPVDDRGPGVVLFRPGRLDAGHRAHLACPPGLVASTMGSFVIAVRDVLYDLRWPSTAR